MLFFKPKSKSEFLPPPHPDSDLELEELRHGLAEEGRTTPVIHSQLPDNHKFFDEIVKPKADTFPEQEEFRNLVKDIESQPVQKTSKKVNIFKKMPLKKQIIAKKIINQTKISKGKKPASQKGAAKSDIKQFTNLEDFGLDINFELPKELQAKENFKLPDLPETLEEFHFEDLNKEASRKPAEILEAEEEIKSAIKSIKRQEKPHFFKKLFTKSPRKEEFAVKPSTDKISLIQDNIKKARGALMSHDLPYAKSRYIEIMRLYSQIMPEEQAKVYHDIRNLYFERKNAEELKI